MYLLAVDGDGFGVEIHFDLAGLDHRLGVSLGATDDGMDTRDQLLPVKGLGHVVVGAEAKGFQLIFHVIVAGKKHDRRLDFGYPQLPQDLVTVYVGKVDVEQYQVVVVDLCQIDAFFAHIGRVYIEICDPQHHLDSLRRDGVIFYKQDSHCVSFRCFSSR